MGEKGRKKQAEEYKIFQEEWRRQLAEKEEYAEDVDYYELPEASLHEKIIRIRKGFKDSYGKPLTQRDFAKFLEYPINKYVEAEKIDKWHSDSEESPVEDLLLERLIFR